MTETKTEQKEVNEKSKPFYHNLGGDKAVLFIHGFTDTNGNFLRQIDGLKKRGIPCMGIRLPGHGTHYSDIDNYDFDDFYKCAEDALLRLSKDYKENNSQLVGIQYQLGYYYCYNA